MVKELESIDWEWFRASEVYKILKQNKDAELNAKQRHQIENWCLENIKRCDFRKARTVKGKQFTTTWLSIYLWYFYHKLSLQYPKPILFDMISFDYWEPEQFSGIEYLIDELNEVEMTERILLNLDEGIPDVVVLKNHLRYCQRFKITEAVPHALKIIRDLEQEDNVRKAALNLICAIPDKNKILKKELCKISDSFVWNIIEVLWNKESEACKAFLKNLLKIGDDESREFAAGYLIEIGCLDGLKIYLKRIQETKRLLKRPDQARGRNSLVRVTGDEGLSLLILLLKESYSNDYEDSMFNSLYNIVIDGLTAFALRSEEEYVKATSAIEKFIASHQDLKNINFLHSFLERLSRKYYINKSVHLNVDEVVMRLAE